jgi:hypothetical protein
VSLVLDQATLRGLHHLAPRTILRPATAESVVALPRHPLFGDLARSIIAYNAGQAIPQLPTLKAQEAMCYCICSPRWSCRAALTS